MFVLSRPTIKIIFFEQFFFSFKFMENGVTSGATELPLLGHQQSYIQAKTWPTFTPPLLPPCRLLNKACGVIYRMEQPPLSETDGWPSIRHNALPIYRQPSPPSDSAPTNRGAIPPYINLPRVRTYPLASLQDPREFPPKLVLQWELEKGLRSQAQGEHLEFR